MTKTTRENPPMPESDAKRALLRHFLAALAYRTQKALRGAPPAFAFFDAGNKARAPKELLQHITSVLGYARTFFVGGTYRAECSSQAIPNSVLVTMRPNALFIHFPT